jgi:hypothetical protein
MKYLDIKLELEEAMECDESKSKVSNLYDQFEQAYKSQQKRKRNCDERLDMYFKFVDYINRNKK